MTFCHLLARWLSEPKKKKSIDGYFPTRDKMSIVSPFKNVFFLFFWPLLTSIRKTTVFFLKKEKNLAFPRIISIDLFLCCTDDSDEMIYMARRIHHRHWIMLKIKNDKSSLRVIMRDLFTYINLFPCCTVDSDGVFSLSGPSYGLTNKRRKFPRFGAKKWIFSCSSIFDR